MDPTCHLLNIPSEVRLLVYQFLFNLDRWKIPRLAGCYNDAAGCCELNLHDGTVYTRRRWSPIAFKQFTAILRTSRLISKEATDVLFAQTIFYMRISDDYYNRTMRLYAPLDQCAFLPRIQQIKINPDLRTYKMLLGLPNSLETLLSNLTALPSKIEVEIEANSGSLSPFQPSATIPNELLVEDEQWLRFLAEIRALRFKVSFHIVTAVFAIMFRGDWCSLCKQLEDERPEALPPSVIAVLA